MTKPYAPRWNSIISGGHIWGSSRARADLRQLQLTILTRARGVLSSLPWSSLATYGIRDIFRGICFLFFPFFFFFSILISHFSPFFISIFIYFLFFLSLFVISFLPFLSLVNVSGLLACVFSYFVPAVPRVCVLLIGIQHIESPRRFLQYDGMALHHLLLLQHSITM